MPLLAALFSAARLVRWSVQPVPPVQLAKQVNRPSIMQRQTAVKPGVGAGYAAGMVWLSAQRSVMLIVAPEYAAPAGLANVPKSRRRLLIAPCCRKPCLPFGYTLSCCCPLSEAWLSGLVSYQYCPSGVAQLGGATPEQGTLCQRQRPLSILWRSSSTVCPEPVPVRRTCSCRQVILVCQRPPRSITWFGVPRHGAKQRANGVQTACPPAVQRPVLHVHGVHMEPTMPSSWYWLPLICGSCGMSMSW